MASHHSVVPTSYVSWPVKHAAVQQQRRDITLASLGLSTTGCSVKCLSPVCSTAIKVKSTNINQKNQEKAIIHQFGDMVPRVPQRRR
ncbi:hypothetical protein BS78_09G095800 [Paspalum vaginatum]|nr:hypothetical protein BS78_09G095800 [Paspalum vaginatum]